MKIETLQWDSEFFNKKIGMLTLADTLNTAYSLEESFDMLYVQSDFDHTLEIKNFIPGFEEVKIVFHKKEFNPLKESNKNIYSSNEENVELDLLYNLAYESGKFSRFNLDQHFKKKDFERLYQIWITNSLNKKFATDLLVYKEEQTVQGFVTYKIHDNHAVIGLIAVSPEAQGKGIGGQLIDFVEDLLIRQNVHELRIPTQQINESACRFYSKKGYEIMQQTHIKHYYKK
ncbi:GNAT family N-acetyltransferase [Flavobacterium sp. '19STA2R22 D10 B1']|uniref:GNAT family N-acetyltransferase n=1 Tax=Flavobacterium aerium TaxID=3037261 RepID=UPI00278C6AA6|nr:GNAT family N-acetyltransferase [Flavobacterium sp. '19STA2R22 D10 B1']